MSGFCYVCKNKFVNLNPDISRIKKTKHFQNMGLCPIAPPKGFPNVYGARLAHRPLETFGHKSFVLFLKYWFVSLTFLFLYKTKTQFPIELRFDFEKIKIPKCRCRRFSPTARGRSVPCGAFLPSPGVLRRGRDIHEPTRSSCYENVGENTDDWRTPQDI